MADSGHDWATLQYLEAEALIEAMESLHAQDVPAYGVHDSLIVPLRHQDKCRRAITQAWKVRSWSIALG
jgi:ribonuclease HI